ncbi:MAG TPA: pirin family protein [Ohtaekwangia sp.]|uniref:pirin family protein n=1 Tax=Ohtaekwangia sp. TaxID=2066019 RepID=UPI002F93B5C4
MKNRTVSTLLYSQVVNMGGMPVRQPFPTQRVEQLDPFLLLHHHRMEANEDSHWEGVGAHPHRGFSPVTFIFEGSLRHRDSRGNNSVVESGGIQWMNAGMGIIHSERPADPYKSIELIQIWINTPAEHKMDQPQYHPVTREEAPAFRSEDTLASARIFSGELLGIKGKINPLSPINAATIDFKKGAKLSIPLPSEHTAFLYLLDGKLSVGGFGLVEDHHAIVFNRDGEGITIEALEDTRTLLMTGKPLDEPVVSYGPFVMNTQTEVMEAMRDYQMGKMGILIED